MKLGIVLGTRPEIIKNYAVVKACRRRGLDFEVIHTNQHHDNAMQQAVFEQMGYRPDRVLDGPYALGKAIDWLCDLIRSRRYDLILTNGDTAAALIAAIAAIYTDVDLAHVEAGLRSSDARMHEERNRIIVDSAAHFLFAYTEYHAAHLARVPDLRGRVFVTGNTTVDLIADFDAQLARPEFGEYAYVTLHRKEFTECKSLMCSVFETLNYLAADFDRIIFPLHPRTLDAMHRHNLSRTLLDKVTLLEPVPPLVSLAYTKYATVVLTDSGCLQEEAYLYGVPCVTLRENTERHETVVHGANVVAGFEREHILRAVATQRAKRGSVFPSIYGPAGAGERIVDVLCRHYASTQP